MYSAGVNTVTHLDSTVHLSTAKEWILSLVLTVLFTQAQRRSEYCHLFWQYYSFKHSAGMHIVTYLARAFRLRTMH